MTGSREGRRHLVVIGAQRSGTTYLHDLLAGHPDVAMARPARPEPKVFLSADLAARGREWYVQEYFGHARDERLLGEKSTSYLEFPEVAGRVREVLGDPLVLVQVRDPIARALSHWAFSTDNGFETRPAIEVLEANLDGPLPWDPSRSSVSPYAYLERGRYTDYLAPWAEEFGSDLHVLLLDEVRRDRGTALFDALGLAPLPTPEDGGEPGAPVNTSSQEVPELPRGLVTRLRGYYRDADQALAELIGRPLPWQDSEGSS